MTDILGPPRVHHRAAIDWALARGAPEDLAYLAVLYWRIAPTRGGVRPDAAFAQACKETGFFRFLRPDGTPSPAVNRYYHNPCGLKTREGGGNDDPNAHQQFGHWEHGVAAHCDHLALYAGADGYPRADTHDPRHFGSLAGRARTWEELGGNWAPSAEYGRSILNDYLEDFMPKLVAPGVWYWTRSQLGLPPSDAAYAKRGAKSEYIQHYTTGDELGRDDFAEWWRQIYNFHTRTRGWADVGYNFGVAVDPDPDIGHVLEGRGWFRVGAHTPGHNTTGIGCAFLGDDDPDYWDATPGARRALKWVAEEGPRVHGRGSFDLLTHRQTKATACPGNELHNWVLAGMPTDPLTTTNEETDDVFMTEVKALYETLLGKRPSDPGFDRKGAAYWAGYLAAGNDYKAMLDVFKDSAGIK